MNYFWSVLKYLQLFICLSCWAFGLTKGLCVHRVRLKWWTLFQNSICRIRKEICIFFSPVRPISQSMWGLNVRWWAYELVTGDLKYNFACAHMQSAYHLSVGHGGLSSRAVRSSPPLTDAHTEPSVQAQSPLMTELWPLWVYHASGHDGWPKNKQKHNVI